MRFRGNRLARMSPFAQRAQSAAHMPTGCVVGGRYSPAGRVHVRGRVQPCQVARRGRPQRPGHLVGHPVATKGRLPFGQGHGCSRTAGGAVRVGSRQPHAPPGPQAPAPIAGVPHRWRTHAAARASSMIRSWPLCVPHGNPTRLLICPGGATRPSASQAYTAGVTLATRVVVLVDCEGHQQ